MQRSQDHRIDLGELKGQIVKKIGVEKSRKYFYYLSRFLSRKLSKSEFDKSCSRLLGRENLPLHNQLILSILRNASLAKSPPPVHETAHSAKSLAQNVQSSPGREEGPEKSGSLVPNHNPYVPVWSNGVLPVSPRKGRSVVRDRKIRDRPSPLGPNGKVESLLHQPICKEDESGNINIENGDMGHFECQRSGRFDDQRENSSLRPAEKMRVSIKDHIATAVNRDEEGEEEYSARLNFLTSPLMAPLGVPFCSASVGGARRMAPVSNSGHPRSCYDSGGLLDSETLRKRMESIAVAQGLGGVTVESANVLNNMVDVYLKKLIKSCVDLIATRSTNGLPRKQTSDKQLVHSKVVNGRWPSNNLHIQTGGGLLDVSQNQHPVSLLDFKVAMELNPQQLGEDWPLLLERICLRLYEEQESGL